MFFSSKRGAGISFETVVNALLVIAFMLVVLSLIFVVAVSVSNQGAKKYSCWLSSSARAGGGPLEGIFPDTCSVIVLDDLLDMPGVAGLLRDTWWMYGHGKADFSIVTEGDVYLAAKFKVSEEILMKDLMDYLLTHRKGKPSTMEKSDYNYLQEDAVSSTVCFDSEFNNDGLKFKKGQEYHLYFADHVASIGLSVINSDRLLVMKELKPRSFWGDNNKFFCYNPLTEIRTEGQVLSEASWKPGGGWIAG